MKLMTLLILVVSIFGCASYEQESQNGQNPKPIKQQSTSNYSIVLLISHPNKKNPIEYRFQYKEGLFEVIDVGSAPFKCAIQAGKFEAKNIELPSANPDFDGSSFWIKCVSKDNKAGFNSLMLCGSNVAENSNLQLLDWAKSNDKDKAQFYTIVSKCGVIP